MHINLAVIPDLYGGLCHRASLHSRLSPSQANELDDYAKALNEFQSILSQRRAQINLGQGLPNLPGQAVYLARNKMISTYKDLTDAVPSKIGRPNKFGIPPAYFDAANEPLLDEYVKLFSVMQAPPANAQNSATPFEDVVPARNGDRSREGFRCGIRGGGGTHQPGHVLCRDQRQPEHRQCALEPLQGQLPDRRVRRPQRPEKNGRRSRRQVRALDSAVGARDDKEQARIGSGDQRYNHWTAVRNGLMNAHVEVFMQIPAILKAFPDPIDQMKIFELIQIVPSPTRSALRSGGLAQLRVSDAKIMGYLRNNSMFTFGRTDRAKTSANYREILAAMWLFNEKFERAQARFDEIKAQRKK